MITLHKLFNQKESQGGPCGLPRLTQNRGVDWLGETNHFTSRLSYDSPTFLITSRIQHQQLKLSILDLIEMKLFQLDYYDYIYLG